MADGPDADQKTEAPSEKRRREARAKGEVLQSRELGTAVVLWAGIGWLLIASGGMVAGCIALLRHSLTQAPGNWRVGADTAFAAAGQPLAAPMLVFAAVATLGMCAAPLLTARVWSPAALLPKFSRINPLAGLQRIFGTKIFFEVGKASLKAVLLFGIGGSVIQARLPALLTLGAASPEAAGAQIAATLGALLAALGGGLLLIAGVDLPVQLIRHSTRLKMSKQEVRDEARESEGSPETKAAQRAQARRAAKRALAPALAEASVVVTNPTEFAVALRYQPGRDTAPIVVARGQDVIAAAIRELAEERGVPVLRYPALTRAIYFTAKVGEPIRDELYAAVAAVLAFVFSLEKLAEQAPPEVEIPGPLHFDTEGRPV